MLPPPGAANLPGRLPVLSCARRPPIRLLPPLFDVLVAAHMLRWFRSTRDHGVLSAAANSVRPWRLIDKHALFAVSRLRSVAARTHC